MSQNRHSLRFTTAQSPVEFWFCCICILPLSHMYSSEQLPSLDQWQCATPLDHSLRHLRVLHLQQIVAAAHALKHGPATELSTVMEQADDWASRLRTMAEEVSLCLIAVIIYRLISKYTTHQLQKLNSIYHKKNKIQIQCKHTHHIRYCCLRGCNFM